MGTALHTAKPLTLRECKVRASILLKALDSPDISRALQAAERLCSVPPFVGLSPREVLARKESVRRKHALAVIAREQGHASWVELKQALGDEAPPRFDAEAFFVLPVSSFLNHWFSSYEEARAALPNVKGYLFPFRDQFFICEASFLEKLDVDLSDPDWERAGPDWMKPMDPAAHARLEQKLIALGYTS